MSDIQEEQKRLYKRAEENDKENWIDISKENRRLLKKIHNIEIKELQDRIDSNKGYFPENCRWTTSKEQCRNISKNINIAYNGEIHCLSAWAEILNINVSTLYWRYKHWNNLEKIFKVEV